MKNVLTFILIAAFYQTHAQTHPAFKAKALVVFSDADMIASSYEDGILNKDFAIQDSLTVLGFDRKEIIKKQAHISNSVIGWPSLFSYSPKTKFGYVAETKGEHHIRSNKVQGVWNGLPDGGHLSVIDLSNTENPKIIQQEKLGSNVFSVSANSSGTILAASIINQTNQVLLATLDKGKISQTFLADTSIIRNYDRITSLYFHPEKDILAINIDNTSIGFYKVIQQDDMLSLEAIGELLEVSVRWSEGKWFNNSNLFAVCDYAFTGLDAPRKGSVKTVKFDENGNHQIISEVKTGLSTEGFDLSPNNRYIVAVNMERSFLPLTFADSLRKKPSLTLIKVDPETGTLERLGPNVEFNGALPEDASFDSESNTIAVASFHEMNEVNPKKGKIEFWEIQNDRLVKLNMNIFLTRGSHYVYTIHE